MCYGGARVVFNSTSQIYFFRGRVRALNRKFFRKYFQIVTALVNNLENSAPDRTRLRLCL